MKTFKEYLSETPLFDPFMRKDTYTQTMANDVRTLTQKIKEKDVKHFGNNFYHHHDKEIDEHYFFKVDDSGKPNEVSVVKDNVHALVYKHEGGKSENVYKNMENAVNMLGHLDTDNTHSVGSLLLWRNANKRLPHFKIEHIDHNGKHHDASGDYIERNFTKIWSKNPVSKERASILRLSKRN